MADNVAAKVEGGKLTLVIDLKHEIGPSTSGKTILIASSGGNADVPGMKGYRYGLNVYKTNDKK